MVSVSEILAYVEAKEINAVKQMLEGPEELQGLVQRCYEYRDKTEPPEWLYAEVRALRPLTRKLIARIFERNGLSLEDNEHTRSLGFFGEWEAPPQ